MSNHLKQEAQPPVRCPICLRTTNAHGKPIRLKTQQGCGRCYRQKLFTQEWRGDQERRVRLTPEKIQQSQNSLKAFLEWREQTRPARSKKRYLRRPKNPQLTKNPPHNF